jgi:hypothetical protein
MTAAHATSSRWWKSEYGQKDPPSYEWQNETKDRVQQHPVHEVMRCGWRDQHGGDHHGEAKDQKDA